MRFSYKALILDGGIEQGELEANDKNAAVDFLNSKGWIPVEVIPTQTGILAELNKPRSNSRNLTLRQLRDITGEIATLLEAGLTLERSLTVVTNMSTDKKVKAIFQQIITTLREGKSLSFAMTQQTQSFPEFYISMIKAGEAGGSLELVLLRLANYLEKSVEVGEKVKSALVYPALLIVMIVVTLALLVTMILPQFQPIFEQAGTQLPIATRLVMQAASFIDHHGITLLISLISLVLIAAWAVRLPMSQRVLHKQILRVPVLGKFSCQREFALLHRMSGILLKSGVPLVSALNVSRQILSNTLIADSVTGFISHLREGSSLSAEYSVNDFVPPVAAELTMVGESSGSLGDMLIKSADIMDDETQQLIDRMITILVPGLTILMGLLIAAIIGSVLVGIMSLNDIAY